MDKTKIEARKNLLEKVLDAFKEAESSGVKNPLQVLKHALKKRADLKAKKTRWKKE